MERRTDTNRILETCQSTWALRACLVDQEEWSNLFLKSHSPSFHLPLHLGLTTNLFSRLCRPDIDYVRFLLPSSDAFLARRDGEKRPCKRELCNSRGGSMSRPVVRSLMKQIDDCGVANFIFLLPLLSLGLCQRLTTTFLPLCLSCFF